MHVGPKFVPTAHGFSLWHELHLLPPDFAGCATDNVFNFNKVKDACAARHLSRPDEPKTAYIAYPGITKEVDVPK